MALIVNNAGASNNKKKPSTGPLMSGVAGTSRPFWAGITQNPAARTPQQIAAAQRPNSVNTYVPSNKTETQMGSSAQVMAEQSNPLSNLLSIVDTIASQHAGNDGGRSFSTSTAASSIPGSAAPAPPPLPPVIEAPPFTPAPVPDPVETRGNTKNIYGESRTGRGTGSSIMQALAKTNRGNPRNSNSLTADQLRKSALNRLRG